ncbi:MAG: hypothetical protein LC118_09485 [Dehalococcoidia bacterium]|nr:hypothetical protein [Dehalococcoidia bacterium]
METVLWFTKGHYSGGWLGDVVNSARAERGLPWEQSGPRDGTAWAGREARPTRADPFCGRHHWLQRSPGVASSAAHDAKAVKVAPATFESRSGGESS